ncbi:MAG TPA: hypothetical protein VMF50_15895 [Candidatus Binataceae bacterium]|nr:hypothetical protein [Candidatus Binataceae bacterium]
MNIFKPALAAVTAIGLFGVTAPAWSQSGTVTHDPMIVDAEVMPTPQEVQTQLNSVGDRLRNDELASFYSPAAENHYLEAERDFKFGQYDRAEHDAQAAAASLPRHIPNWQGGMPVSQRN